MNFMEKLLDGVGVESNSESILHNMVILREVAESIALHEASTPGPCDYAQGDGLEAVQNGSMKKGDNA